MARKGGIRDLGCRLSNQSRVLDKVSAATRVNAATDVHSSLSPLRISMVGLRINLIKNPVSEIRRTRLQMLDTD